MKTLEEIFVQEFNQMMAQRKAETGFINLQDIPLPDSLRGRMFIEKNELAYINGISDEYYSKLNDSEVKLFPKVKLNRRKFDYKGEYIKDKNGNFVLEDVTLPNGCVAILSDTRIGVPLKYKPSEPFEYVDVISKEINGVRHNKFIYIVPKNYCYKLNQTALVLSWTKLRVYYSGVRLALTNGHYIFFYVIPYKPTTSQHNYRVLHCKTTDDFSEEVSLIRDFWLKHNFIFNPADCELFEGVKGRENMAYERINGVLDEYERYNPEKPMSGQDDSDMFYFEEKSS